MRIDTGMKSLISATPAGARKRESRMLVSSRYNCLRRASSINGLSWKWPPLCSSSRAAKTVGESKYGNDKKSIDAFMPTSATVWRLPTTP